jgi:hypothetical protein
MVGPGARLELVARRKPRGVVLEPVGVGEVEEFAELAGLAGLGVGWQVGAGVLGVDRELIARGVADVNLV